MVVVVDRDTPLPIKKKPPKSAPPTAKKPASPACSPVK